MPSRNVSWLDLEAWKAFLLCSLLILVGCDAAGPIGREKKATKGAFEIHGKSTVRRPSKLIKPEVMNVVRQISNRKHGNEGIMNNVTDMRKRGQDSSELEACTLRDQSSGLVYDLSPLHFLAKDMHSAFLLKGAPGGRFDHPNRRYNYLFNFCGNVPNLVLPEMCKAPGLGAGTVFQYSSKLTSDRKDDAKGAQAEEMHHSWTENIDSDGTCFRLGSLGNWGYAVLDKSNPQWGVTITYHDGQICRRRVVLESNTRSKKYSQKEVAWEDFPRETKIVLLCDPYEAKSLDPNIDLEHMVDADHYAEEEEMCQYTIVYSTVHACPKDYAQGRAYSGAGRTFSWLGRIVFLLTLGTLLGLALQVVRRWRWISLYTEHLKEPATRVTAMKKIVSILLEMDKRRARPGSGEAMKRGV